MAVRLNPVRFTASRHTALGFLLGAALVGGALGFTADRVIGERACRRVLDDPRGMRELFAEELHLSSTQRAAVDSIMHAKHRAYTEIVGPVQPRLDSLGAATAAQIKSRLDPDQQVTFDRLDATMKARKRGGM